MKAANWCRCPNKMHMLVGKAVNLAKLQTQPNRDKNVALLFWNHPPGEKNQGASNMNVPRSIEYLVEQLRTEGYAFDSVSEQKMIDTVGQMLRPAYRKGGIPELMRTAHCGIPAAGNLQALVRHVAGRSAGGTSKNAGVRRKKVHGSPTRRRARFCHSPHEARQGWW